MYNEAMLGLRVRIFVHISLIDMFNKRNMSICHVYIRSVLHSHIRCTYFKFEHVSVYNETFIFTEARILDPKFIFEVILLNKEKSKR